MGIRQTITIRLSSFDHRLLDRAVESIIGTVSATGTRVRGPIPLPTRKERYTMNCSPHVDKRAREQFEIRNHLRLLVIELDKSAVAALRQLDLPAGVNAGIRLSANVNEGLDGGEL